MIPPRAPPATNWMTWVPVVLSLGGLLWVASVKVSTIDAMQREVAENSKIVRDNANQLAVLTSRIETIAAERTRVLAEIWQSRDRALSENAEAHRAFDARLRALETERRNER